MNEVIIYTDGACSHNPGPGGWAAVLIYNGHEREMSGGVNLTTNNKMELTACIKALEALKRPCKIELYTDSKYVQEGMTKWVDGWKRRGWKTSAGKPVKNKELWWELIMAAQPHNIEWIWIEGHAGIPINERVDTLAQAAVP